MKYSTNYGFRKPEGTDPPDIDDISYDMEQIDSTIHALDEGIDGRIDTKIAAAVGDVLVTPI